MLAQGVQALIVPPSHGTAIHAMGDTAVSKITSAQTKGAMLVTEYTVSPGGGPPLHVHDREDELFWVLEGEVWFAAADKRERATPGTLVYGPRGIPHTFRNRSNRSARMLVIVTPGENFERFFTAIAAARSPEEAVARINELAPIHGIRMLGPSGLEAPEET